MNAALPVCRSVSVFVLCVCVCLFLCVCLFPLIAHFFFVLGSLSSSIFYLVQMHHYLFVFYAVEIPLNQHLHQHGKIKASTETQIRETYLRCSNGCSWQSNHTLLV